MDGQPAADLPPWPGEPESMLVTLDTGDHIHYLDWRPALSPPDQPTDRRAGDALPSLLLLHGLAQTAWQWTPIARRLGPLTPTIAADLRGHGLSDSPRGGYELESLAFDALTVLTANGWGADASGPPAVVAGHGLGAMVAATMALVRPASIAAVALVDAGWEDMASATGQDAHEFKRTLGDPPEVLASMGAYLADRRDFDPATWNGDQERAARAAVDEKHAGHVAPVTRAHALRGAVDAMFGYESETSVAALAVPLLIAVAESGAADDESARERSLALDDVLRRRAQAGLPAAEVIRFRGAGHNLMRYRPDELSLALLGLLRRAAATSVGTRGGRT